MYLKSFSVFVSLVVNFEVPFSSSQFRRHLLKKLTIAVPKPKLKTKFEMKQEKKLNGKITVLTGVTLMLVLCSFSLMVNDFPFQKS